MREIKFRAFDKENKEMLYVSTLFLEGQFGGEGFGVSNTPYRNIDPETIMQYTELKDKNGVEIYEGDVVQFHSFIKAPTESDYFGTGVIEYRPDFMMFVISQKNRDWTYEETSDIDEDCIEVIGNIYENPELLEK